MNYDEILAAFKNASGFDLYRLRVMLDRMLDDPKWIAAVGVHLHVGQRVLYYDAGANQQHEATILELRRKDVVVRHESDKRRWAIPYTCINLQGADVKIRETGVSGLSRHEVSIGDLVGFMDNDHRQRQGRVMRLNDKTVTINSDGQKWRVPYDYLHRVIEAGKA